MPNFADSLHEARAFQIRRCLQAMTDHQIDKGLTAFESGSSSWSNCFWARVFQGEKNLDAIHRYVTRKGVEHSGTYAIEWWIADRLGLPSNVPVRIVYNLFDGVGRKAGMTREGLRDFINKARIEGDDSAAVLDLLRSLPSNTFDIEPSWQESQCPSL